MKLGALHRPPPPHRLTAGLSLVGTYQPRDTVDYYSALNLDGSDALGNDRLSNCVECAFLRLAQARWHRLAPSDPWVPTEALATALYGQWSDYPAQDIGTDTVEAANQWLAHGIWIKPNLLDIGPLVNVGVDHVRAATDIAEGCVLILSLHGGDETAEIWGPVTPGAEVIGAHAVCCLGYDFSGMWVATWGRMMLLTPEGLAARFLDCLCPISRLVTDTHGLAPNGQSWGTIVSDLNAIERAPNA